jgi:hypothetical protein
VPSVAELIDQGVKAYARGEAAEAERCFSEALALDPRNERAGAYLRQLRADPSPAPAAARSPWDDGPASAATIVIDPDEGLERTPAARRRSTCGWRALASSSRWATSPGRWR